MIAFRNLISKIIQTPKALIRKSKVSRWQTRDWREKHRFNLGFHGKTLWDWLQLLIVPAALALVVWLFNSSLQLQNASVEATRISEQRQIEDARAKEQSLQSYYDNLSDLLLHQNLRNSAADSEVRTIARAKTLSIMRTLDDTRRGPVIKFLYESKLIMIDEAIIHLNEADLRGANLSGANLGRINLCGADLSMANLRNAWLSEAYLSRANLSGADLSGAYLRGAGLQNADLTRANLSVTDLTEADLIGADLSGANLRNVYLGGADLIEADLSGADLHFAWLVGANLYGANLSEANMSGTYLDETNLSGVKYNSNTTWPDGFDPVAAGCVD